MKENADLNKQDLSSLDWWEKTVKCLVFVVCEEEISADSGAVP